MDITPLINYFSDFWALDKTASNALQNCLLHRSVKRRECILKPGDICNTFIFVVKGCLKMYKVDDHGHQHNLQFATENTWTTDYGSFYAEEPTDLCIEALEPTDVLQLKNTDLYFLYDNFPVFDRNFRIIIENAFIEQQKRVLQNISSTAEERYLYFLKRYPDLSNRISNVQIASYLGITPEFLSVVRKKVATR